MIWPSSLTKTDRALFERFKIPAELVKAAGIKRVTDAEARKELFLHAPAGCSLAGLAFLYPSPEDEAKFHTCRVRRDKPDVVDGKTKNKYMAPKGGPRCLYRPPGAAERLRNPNTVIVLAEAEKSALALTAWAEREERSILALATGGCWGWSLDKAPLHDLGICRDRRVYVMLDANAATNPDVQKARAALATALRSMDCDVLVADMPQIEGVNGPDDLLALEDGDKQLDAVLSAARPAVAAPHSEDALAARFAEQQKDDLRYVRDWDKWFVWDGMRWHRDDTGQVLARTATMLEIVAGKECGKESAGNRLRSANTIEKVARLAGLHDRLAATTDQWDADPWLLNTPSGIVDLRTGLLRPARREDYCTKMTAVALSKEPRRRWLRFLKEITNDNRALQDYLQQVGGYCLTGDTSEHAMFFLYGTGANGKSVFLSTISELLGDYARSTSMDSFVVSHNASHPTDVAGLRGARLATASETADGRRWDEAKLKTVTGGERIPARFMRQDFFEYMPQFKLMLSGNHRPGLRDTSEAMRRRLHLVPFTVTIPSGKRDPRLAEKLRDEWGSILQWMIYGCLAWQKQGLAKPKAVVDATEEYLASQDVLGRWLEEAVKEDAASRTQPSVLYQSFNRWAVAAGEKYVYSQKEFSQRMAERGYKSKPGHAKKLYVYGLRLRTEGEGGGFTVQPSSNFKDRNFAKGVNSKSPSSPLRALESKVGGSRKFAGGRPMVN